MGIGVIDDIHRLSMHDSLRCIAPPAMPPLGRQWALAHWSGGSPKRFRELGRVGPDVTIGQALRIKLCLWPAPFPQSRVDPTEKVVRQTDLVERPVGGAEP